MINSKIKNISAKIKSIFGFDMPTDVEWRTSDHPEYEKDKKIKSGKEKRDMINLKEISLMLKYK